MPIEFKTYKEYLADEAEASKEYVGDHCFIAGCTNPPPYYKDGDARSCCDECNRGKVIPARLKLATGR